MQRDFKGIWIPKQIWLSTDLKIMEKLVLVEIDSLDNEEGCYASNEHFSKFFSLSKNRCSEIIKSLESKGYIEIKYIHHEGSKAILKRIITCTRKTEGGIRKIDRPIRKTEEGYSEKCEGNNTSFNNTVNNTVYIKDIVEQSPTPSSTDVLIDEIIRYINLKTGKNFRTTTKDNRRYISARIKEGATPEQIKYVIDVKCAEWLHSEEMKQHLNPKTLFREGNFDKYLNQPMPQNKKTLRDLAHTGQIDLSDVL